MYLVTYAIIHKMSKYGTFFSETACRSFFENLRKKYNKSLLSEREQEKEKERNRMNTARDRVSHPPNKILGCFVLPILNYS